jgi:hypothetical protein
MQGLRLGTSEIDRLRGSNLKNLLRERKLVLILDLDHTLINSTKLQHISSAENELGIRTAALKGNGLVSRTCSFFCKCIFYYHKVPPLMPIIDMLVRCYDIFSRLHFYTNLLESIRIHRGMA